MRGLSLEVWLVLALIIAVFVLFLLRPIFRLAMGRADRFDIRLLVASGSILGVLAGGLSLWEYAVTRLPSKVTLARIEAAYAAEIAHVRQVAHDMPLRLTAGPDARRQLDHAVLSHPSVLNARIQIERNAWQELELPPLRSTSFEPPSPLFANSPGVGSPVLNSGRAVLQTGESVHLVEYAERIVDAAGNEVTVTLTLRADALKPMVEE